MSWTAVNARLPYHHNPTRQAPSTLLPHQVGTVADRQCHYVRVVSVPRSPQAPCGVMLAEQRLADVVQRALRVTEEAWAVPAGFTLSDMGDVPPSTEEAAASAAYRPRKRRHADIVGGPAHALAWLLRGDSRATFCGDSADSRPTAWIGRSAIWRHNKFPGAGPVHDQDNENDVHAAKSHAKCALKDNLLTSVGTATLTSYSDDITLSKRS